MKNEREITKNRTKGILQYYLQREKIRIDKFLYSN